MGIISKDDWSGTIINGVTLGIPKKHANGDYEWDGGVPVGVIDAAAEFTPAEPNAVKVSAAALPGVVIREWVQPEGAHDAYPLGQVIKFEDKLWISTTAANVQKPGVSGWRQVSLTNPTQAFPWVQPAGAHDAYKIGDKITFNGFTWESLINANVWSPTGYPAGWKKL